MHPTRVLVSFVLTFLLAACGDTGTTPTPPTETPPVEQPPVVSPPIVTPPVEQPPENPNAVPYAGEWLVTYTSSENSSDTFTYALNVTDGSGTADLDGGTGFAIACQSNTLCEYEDGASTTGFGLIGNLEISPGNAPLTVGILDEGVELFYYADDTNNAVGADAQGRQVIEGLGAWESSPEQYTAGLVTATRIGDARTLQPAPTTPEEPTPPGEPEPPTDPEPTPEPPVIRSFMASPETIESGDNTRLSWDVENADTLSISPDVGTVMGSSVVVEPDETTTYTLTATNDDGSDNATARVSVEEPAPPEPEEPDLQYWVNSDCGEVSTTYATAGGGTAQRDFGNGVVYESDSFSSGDFVYISAQNQCDSGDVTVRIYKRGSIYRETSSSGAYVIATASGTF